MPLNTNELKLVCFDLGNTLIEWGPRQADQQYAALEKQLTEMFGYCDPTKLRAIRRRQARAPYENGYRENVLTQISGELVAELYRVTPTHGHVQTIIEARRVSFMESVSLGADVRTLLEGLARRYRLGMISNYPFAEVIRDSLRQMGIADLFAAIVISAEVGFTKPHPRPFEVLLSDVNMAPLECVHVGDNWLADIQGAKQMGMQAILTTQHEPFQRFEPQEGDWQPDARVTHLNELGNLL